MFILIFCLWQELWKYFKFDHTEKDNKVFCRERYSRPPVSATNL